jgi:hypothetical protein
MFLPQNNLENSSRILREHADDIACLFMKPHSRAGGLVEFATALTRGQLSSSMTIS